MKLSVISKSVSAFVATFCLVSGSLAASSDSCYQDVRDQLQNANAKLDRIKQLEHRLSQEAPTPITQKMMHEADGTLVLKHSGDYCLTENICGTIVIEANSVCLDLCCHTLNAKGEPNAIIAADYQGLKIFDGRIINASIAAISIDNFSAVELFKLILNNNALDAIHITNSTDLNVHDIDFINDNSVERALWFDTCNNITVTHCNATGFLSTIGAIIQLDGCNAASLQDVDVSGNTKTAGANVNEFSPGTAFVSVAFSSGIHFVHVKVNNNTFNNSIPIADQSNHHRTAEAINFVSSNSCSLHRCETSNNIDIVGSGATPITEDSILSLSECSGFIITEHQCNNNTCPTAIISFIGIALYRSSESILENCQANTNIVDELYVLPFVFAQMHGIWVAGFGDGSSQDNVLRNCQANDNTVNKGGAGRSPGTLNPGLVAGVRMNGTGHVIDGCQANQNSMGDSPEFTLIFGFLKSADTNGVLSNSTADNNVGGERAYGISLHPLNFGFIFGADQIISNCSANSNGNYGISTGLFSDPLPEFAANVVISNCVCNKNGTGSGPAAGIIIVNPAQDRSIVIKNCQIADTGTAASTIAVGVHAITAANVVIEDCNIFNTTADDTGHGILFDTVSDSKIIRTQVHGNQNSGIELQGVNSNVLILDSIAVDNDKGFSVADGSTLIEGVIQGNRAIGNQTVGFEHAAVLPAPFDTGYQNNYAQNNGVNFSIIHPIQIFTYDIPTATYVLVPNGASNYPTQANIDAS
ncbi:MAG: right-handed parallel beta-helix repeat-containing protein [Chlamydiales bacterium]|nr:right-handed parallel beta-helix repeat-containing protein [Chlamydiales bacterium]